MLAFAIGAVYGINGARGFWRPFWQIYAIAMAEGLFDRFFIDWYWVGHTRKTRIVKWVITIIGNPLIAAALAGIMLLFF